jgi:acetolactate synthase I/III small subunit
MKPHTLLVLLQDRPGVLHRAVTLLRRHGLNISSLHVCKSETPGVSRMTLVVDATDTTLILRQLDRLVEVIEVSDITPETLDASEHYCAQADGVRGEVAA